MTWEDKSRLKRLGEKHDLESLEGHWIKPIKYSIEGEEEINLAKLRLKDHYPKGFIRKLAKKYPGLESKKPAEMAAALDEEDLDEMLNQTTNLTPGEQSAHIQLTLLHGIGEHNMENGEGKPEKVTEDFIKRICENKELATEIQAVIVDHNRPLASGSGSKSGTQQSGSVEASSSKKALSSKTVASPAS